MLIPREVGSAGALLLNAASSGNVVLSMLEPVPSLSAFPVDLQAAYPHAELIWGILEASLTGLALYTPLYNAQGHLVDFRIDLLNPAAQQMLHQPARPTDTYLAYYPHTLTSGVFAFHRDTFESGIPARLNVNYQADGLDNYFQLSARRVGQGLLVSFTDTAEAARTEVELALRESQAQALAARADAELQRQQLYNILQQAPAMICLFEGPEHTFQFVNPPYQALVGDRPILGRPIAEAMPELAGQPIFDLLDQVYQTGETFYANEMLVQLDHGNEGIKELEKRYYNFIYQARYNLADTIDGIFVFAYDVTSLVLARHEVQHLNEELTTLNEELYASNEEYQNANLALQQTQAQLQQLNQELEARVAKRTAVLQESEASFRTMADAAPAMLWVTDPEGYCTYLNAQWYQYTGQTEAEALGLGWTKAVHPDDAEKTAHLFLDANARRVQFHLRYRLRRHDGVYRWATDTGLPRFTEAGEYAGLVGTVIDVHEQQLAEEDLQATNQQLRHTNADLDNFIYTASHDLKAPISNIEGLLYLLREELPPAVAEGEYIGPTLTRMLEAVERFKRTIEHLTEVAKLQKEHAAVTQAVSLATVLEDVQQDLAPLIQQTGVRLLVAVSDFPPVQFSEKNLRSVVYNLLSNALKYRSPDRSLHVDVRAHVRASFTVLEVHDNGLGIEPGHLPKLFTMFQRFHPHVEGSGVGLYMVKRMVDNAGGRLEVHSQPGAGTTFFVHLPHAANTPT